MKLLNDLKLQFEKELWALNPELAVIDTILSEHPKIIEIVKEDITGGEEASGFGRQDTPTVEQIVRAAIYKEMKNLTYQELEFAQHDSRLYSVFIKLDDRKERILNLSVPIQPRQSKNQDFMYRHYLDILTLLEQT